MLQFLFGGNYRRVERQMVILGRRLGIPAQLPASRKNPFSKYYPKIEGTLMKRIVPTRKWEEQTQLHGTEL